MHADMVHKYIHTCIHNTYIHTYILHSNKQTDKQTRHRKPTNRHTSFWALIEDERAIDIQLRQNRGPKQLKKPIHHLCTLHRHLRDRREYAIEIINRDHQSTNVLQRKGVYCILHVSMIAWWSLMHQICAIYWDISVGCTAVLVGKWIKVINGHVVMWRSAVFQLHISLHEYMLSWW
jgi:hypothetical protein